MAYDEFTADRIRQNLSDKGVYFEEKKMMGGLCIMVDEKMLMGVLFNKKIQKDLIMARIGPDAYESALIKPGCLPMDFTGRPMKGFVFITPEGFDSESDLDYWIDMCLVYNPLAKSSKKKKK